MFRQPLGAACLLLLATLLLPFICSSSSSTSSSSSSCSWCFQIRVVDEETGDGVPLVLIRTGHYLEFYSDSAGFIAFAEPDFVLIDSSPATSSVSPLFITVLTDGYMLSTTSNSPYYIAYDDPYDSGLLVPTSRLRAGSGEFIIYLHRTQLAARRFRLTGAGLYRDTILSGATEWVPENFISPLMEWWGGGILGQDTLMLALFRENQSSDPRIWWLFGDTVCTRSARQRNCEDFGMHTVGATSCVPSSFLSEEQFSSASTCPASPSPPSLFYFNETTQEKDGSSFTHMRPLAPFEPIEQNTWLAALIVLELPKSTQVNEEEVHHHHFDTHHGNNKLTKQVLYANYMKNPGDGEGAGPIRSGMARWNRTLQQFEKLSEWPLDSNFLNGAHTILMRSDTDASDGYIYFPHRYRVRAEEKEIVNYYAYETFVDGRGWISINDTVASVESLKQQQHDGDVRSMRMEAIRRRKGGFSSSASHSSFSHSSSSSSSSSYEIASVEWNAYMKAYMALLVLNDFGGHLFVSFSANLTGPWFPGDVGYSSSHSPHYHSDSHSHSQFHSSSSSVPYHTAMLIASHNSSGSSCYNPIWIPYWQEENGSRAYFACTYTSMWSDTAGGHQTWSTCLFGLAGHRNCAPVVPRYEYNNLVYSLDLQALVASVDPYAYKT